MKKLTAHRMALARLRADKRSYLTLTAGVFLSVFLVTTMCLCIQGVVLAQKEKTARELGYLDAFLLDYSRVTDGELEDTGLFDRTGHVYLLGNASDTGLYLGYLDEAALALLNRQPEEGRLPESTGEIAMERSALLSLQEGDPPALGDTVTLEIAPVDGIRERREFTLVGILYEQSQRLSTGTGSSIDPFVSSFPAAITDSRERFSTGRLACHRVMTLRKGVSGSEAFDRMTSQFGYLDVSDHFFEISASGTLMQAYTNPVSANDGLFQLILMAVLLFAALLLSCCVGIAGSMEGLLRKRWEEIGILRAIGATRRQIRRMFGRETLLIAVITAPGSILLGCAASALLAALFPEVLRFRAAPWLLLPVAALSIAVILIAGSRPLRRAAGQMPMGILRDKGFLRKASSFSSRKQFQVPRLITRRLLRLYPTRQLGAACLAGLTFFCTAVLCIAIGEGVETFSPSRAGWSIVMSGNNTRRMYVSFLPGAPLSDGSLAQLRRLPHVSQVTVDRQVMVNLLFDETPEYFTPLDPFPISSEDSAAFREAFGISQELINTKLYTCVLTDAMVETLESAAGQGAIHPDAINGGAEVLVYAPTVWEDAQSDDSGYYRYYGETPPEKGDWVPISENDCFFAGQALPICQLYTDDCAVLNSADPNAPQRRQCTVTVGAVLTRDMDGLSVPPGSIITTEQGLRNMGLYPNGYDEISIFLDGPVDQETEEMLTRSISAIAMRSEGSYVNNYLVMQRANAQTRQQLILVFACISLVFFAVSAGMLVSSVTRQLQTDGQRIGMLRAVGADEKTILGCYSGQAGAAILAGLLLAALAGAAVDLFQYVQYGSSPIFLPGFWAAVLAAALSTLLCQGVLRLRVRELTKQSIIDNIREL